MKLLHRIRHAIRWRWLHYSPVVREFRRSVWAQACVAGRWIFKLRRRPQRLSAPLIVSLTSYPPRFAILHLTLRSLLRQTVKPDHTILWIAHADLPLLPDNVTRLQAEGLEIRATDDLKSYKKIIPALDAFPDTFIATSDDDIYYWPTWLEELVEGARGADRVVTCHRAHKITLDPRGRFRPYDQWILDVRTRGTQNALFPTGVGGILYPPGILSHTVEDREVGLNLCPHGDDIWLYWVGRRNGATYKTVGRRRDLVAWRSSQEHALWHRNISQGGNDEQIRKMVEKYGYPK